jgi:hypothetical protein
MNQFALATNLIPKAIIQKISHKATKYTNQSIEILCELFTPLLVFPGQP